MCDYSDDVISKFICMNKDFASFVSVRTFHFLYNYILIIVIVAVHIFQFCVHNSLVFSSFVIVGFTAYRHSICNIAPKMKFYDIKRVDHVFMKHNDPGGFIRVKESRPRSQGGQFFNFNFVGEG